MEGVANHGTYWHAITATLFQGGSIVLMIAAIIRIFVRPGTVVRGLDIGLANGTLVVLAAVWALAFAVLATITGIWMTWGYEATTGTSLTMNKSMFATFGILALVLLLALRWRYGPAVWRDPALTASYVAMAVVQGVVAAVNGSLGGEAGLLGTILDPIWRLLRIEVRGSMVLPNTAALILLVVLIGVLVGLVVWRFAKRKAPPAASQPASA